MPNRLPDQAELPVLKDQLTLRARFLKATLQSLGETATDPTLTGDDFSQVVTLQSHVDSLEARIKTVTARTQPRATAQVSSPTPAPLAPNASLDERCLHATQAKRNQAEKARQRATDLLQQVRDGKIRLSQAITIAKAAEKSDK